VGKKKRRGRDGGLGRGCVGWRSTRGIEREILDLNLSILFKFKSHTMESNNFKNPSPTKYLYQLQL
jgi:hypothetical protein